MFVVTCVRHKFYLFQKRDTFISRCRLTSSLFVAHKMQRDKLHFSNTKMFHREITTKQIINVLVEDIFCSSIIIIFIFLVPCLHKHLGAGE